MRNFSRRYSIDFKIVGLYIKGTNLLNYFTKIKINKVFYFPQHIFYIYIFLSIINEQIR
jgi:hypothetical protein